MKKIITAMLIATMALSLASCGGKNQEKAGEQTANETATEENTSEQIANETATEQKAIFDNAVDINDNPVGADVIKDAKVVLLNLWEPWCGPCVGEMPDLEKLYENYKDQGLVIVGVFSSLDSQSDAENVIAENGITYPILKMNEDLSSLQQQYVPCTYFLDGEGRILTEEPYIGSKSYEEWESLVKSYLE